MRFPLLAIAALCMSSLAAHADNLTQTVASGPFTTSTDTTFQSNAVTFEGFDPALGTLTAISLTYQGQYTVLQTGSSSQNYGNSSLDLLFNVSGTQVGQGEFGRGTFAFDQSVRDSNARDFMSFVGQGQLSGSFYFADGLYAQDTSTNITTTIVYSYTPSIPAPAVTPEPSSLALLGTGVIGVIGAARRRFTR